MLGKLIGLNEIG